MPSSSVATLSSQGVRHFKSLYLEKQQVWVVGFWRHTYLLLLIYLFLALINALKGIINCRNLFISLTSETLVLARISHISAKFTEYSEQKAIDAVSLKQQPSDSSLNLDDPNFASVLNQP